MLDFERLVFAPGVAMIGNTTFINAGLEDAVELSGATDAAEKEGTPLNNLLARVMGDEQGRFEPGNGRGGNGDDLAEFAGRQCYRSWGKGRSNREYIENVQAMGHGSVFEHASIVFQIAGVSRSLTHELIRHRVGTAYSQESQRYVDAKDIRFVVPPLLANAYDPEASESVAWRLMMKFRDSCQRSLDDYIEIQPMLKELAEQSHAAAIAGNTKVATAAQKRANEAARSVLPNATETRLVFTVNLRQMYHVVLLRGGEPADLEIRRFVVALLDTARDYAPNFFRDVQLYYGADSIEALRSETSARL